MIKCNCISSTHGHLTKECSNEAVKDNVNNYCEYCEARAAKEATDSILQTPSTPKQIPKQLPPELLDEYTEVEKFFVSAVQPSADPSIIDDSFNRWKKLYEKILKSQPNDSRYHKGGEVHNMGVCKYYTLEVVDSLKYFLLGYIEDLLSESISSANQAPGASNLKNIFHLTDVEFTKIQKCVEDVIKDKGIVKDPQDVLKSFSELKMYEEIIKKVKKLPLLIRPDRYPSVSHLPDEWEQRVFIGGDYESISSLSLIIKAVVDFGLRPIIAMEFHSSPDKIHHDALLLLHNCKYAIFDVSGKGGHMMEAERTLDYGTLTLFVCKNNEAPRVSAMLKSLGDKYEIRYFDDRKELKKHIYDFLRPVDIEPAD